jgi:hypothetical protein
MNIRGLIFQTLPLHVVEEKNFFKMKSLLSEESNHRLIKQAIIYIFCLFKIKYIFNSTIVGNNKGAS